MPLLGNSFLNSKELWSAIPAAVIGLIVLILLSDFLYYRRQRKEVGDIPLVHDGTWFTPLIQWWKSEFNWEKELQRAYQMYTKNGKPFAHTDPLGIGTIIVLPPQCSKEYINLPRGHVSFAKLLIQDFFLEGIHDPSWEPGIHAVHTAVQNLPMKFLGGVAVKELDHVLPQFLSGSNEANEANNDDWHLYPTWETISKIAFEICYSISLSSELRKNPVLAQQIKIYLESMSSQSSDRRIFPRILGLLAWRFSPSCRALRSSMAVATKLIAPEVTRQLQEFDEQEKVVNRGNALFLDIMVEQAARKDSKQGDAAGRKQYSEWITNQFLWRYFELMAAIPDVVTYMLFQIMREPNYITPLREELTAALEQCQGQWGIDVFNHTPILESFTTEIFRFHGPIYETADRRVIKPLYLPSLNMTLQPGSNIGLPAHLIHRDPDNYHEPDTFDAYRFYDATSKHYNPKRSITATDIYIPFGIGQQACPGRLLGVRLCQLIFAKILHNYDLGSIEKDETLYLHFVRVFFPNPELNMRIRARREQI